MSRKKDFVSDVKHTAIQEYSWTDSHDVSVWLHVELLIHVRRGENMRVNV